MVEAQADGRGGAGVVQLEEVAHADLSFRAPLKADGEPSELVEKKGSAHEDFTKISGEMGGEEVGRS